MGIYQWQVQLSQDQPVLLSPGRHGLTSTFGLKNAEERGVLFIGAGVDVYEGMVVGETQRPDDLIGECLQEETSYQYALIE